MHINWLLFLSYFLNTRSFLSVSCSDLRIISQTHHHMPHHNSPLQSLYFSPSQLILFLFLSFSLLYFMAILNSCFQCKSLSIFSLNRLYLLNRGIYSLFIKLVSVTSEAFICLVFI